MEGVNQTYDFLAGLSSDAGIIRFITDVVWARFIALIKAPIINQDMLWIAIPVIASLILVQIYLGRYKDEGTSINEAFGNSLVLIFVGFDLLRHLYTSYGPAYSGNLVFTIKVMIGFFLIVEGFVLMFMDFFHLLPERIAVFMGGPIMNGMTTYTAIVLIYSEHVPIDLATILAAIMLFIALFLMFTGIRYIIPTSSESQVRMMEKRLEEMKVKKKSRAR